MGRFGKPPLRRWLPPPSRQFCARVGRQKGSPPRPRSAPGRGGLDGGRFAPAWGADVVSSNIVGYQKLTLQAGYNLIANGFRVVGSDTAPALQDMFSDAASNATGTLGQDTADNILVWTGTGYTTYWFYDATGTDDEDPDYDKKWYDTIDESTPSSAGIDAADGAWYIGRNATTLTIAGEVSKSAVSVDLQNGYNLIANPFPAALTLNDPSIDWSSMGVTGTLGQDTADNILVWTGTGYTTYWFYDATGTDDADPDYDKKWYDTIDESTPSSASIPAGVGVWFIHRGAATTITLPSPIAE